MKAALPLPRRTCLPARQNATAPGRVADGQPGDRAAEHRAPDLDDTHTRGWQGRQPSLVNVLVWPWSPGAR